MSGLLSTIPARLSNATTTILSVCGGTRERFRITAIATTAKSGNNPVKYIDTDGRKIVDTKGNILYQNGKWTNAAKNTDAMRAGNAMMKTNIGRNTWNEMAAAAYDI